LPAQKMAKRHAHAKALEKIDPYKVTPNKPAIRRMRLRAGILSAKDTCNDEIRADVHRHLTKVIDTALMYTAHARRKRMRLLEVKQAIASLSRTGQAIRVLTDEDEDMKKTKKKAVAAAAPAKKATKKTAAPAKKATKKAAAPAKKAAAAPTSTQ